MKTFKHRHILTLVLTLFVAVMALFVFASVTSAMVIRGGEDYSLEDYQTVEDDLYVGAESVTLSGTTTGDVIAAGSGVLIDGVVTQDAIVAGGDVRIYGDIQGDLRTAGGEVYIDGHIQEDAVLAGGKVTITQQSVIEGDLLVFADYFEYMGTTSGSAKIYANTILLKGGIGGTVEIKAKNSISIQERASIQGDLIYESPREAFIVNEDVVQGVIEHKEMKIRGQVKGINWYSLFLEILIAIVAAYALTHFFPRFTRDMLNTVFKEDFWNSLKGLGLLFAIPLLAIFTMLTMIGILPGILLLFMYASSIVLAMALSPVIAGVILARWAKKEGEELQFAWISAGAFALAIVAFLPIVGVLVQFLIFLFAFYAVLAQLYRGVWLKRKEVSTAVTTKEEENEKESNTNKEQQEDESDKGTEN